MNAVSATEPGYAPLWGASLLSALNSARGSSVAAGNAGSSSTASNTVTLSDTGQKLAAQNNDLGSTLLQRATQLGQATMNAAIQFVNNFAQSLFGASTSNMQLSMDSGQLSTSASYSSTAQAANSGQPGATSSTSELQESSDFVGTGTMVTADGKRFTFQVELAVQLQATEQVSTAAPTGSAAAASAQSPAASTHLPMTMTAAADNNQAAAIQFPGSLDSFLSLLNEGQFTQPIQVNSTALSNASDTTARSGMLKFSLLNQLPSI